MDTAQIREQVKQGLDRKFDGANNWYSIFYVFGATREEVEPVLVELKQKGYFEYGLIRYDAADNIFSFVGWKESADAAQNLSALLPGKLCIGEAGWDYNYACFYINGDEAVKNTDYTCDLWYEERDEDDDEPYYDMEYTVTNSNGFKLNSFFGVVTEQELDSFINMSTSSKEGLPVRDYDNEKEEI